MLEAFVTLDADIWGYIGMNIGRGDGDVYVPYSHAWVTIGYI